ncbi:MAG: prepilin-type N-terminal cleavage/methylation domain-containing protein [Bacilli bacterium]
MKNNKGITIIELLISFAIVSVASFYFYQTVLIVKKMYEETRTATNFSVAKTYATRLLKAGLEKGYWVTKLTDPSKLTNEEKEEDAKKDCIMKKDGSQNFKLDNVKNCKCLTSTSDPNNLMCSFTINKKTVNFFYNIKKTQ